MSHTPGNETLSQDVSAIKWLQYAVYGSLILYFGRNIFIPVSFAVLISFILYPVCAWLERKGIGRLSAILIPLTGLLLAGLLIVALLVYQFVGFMEEWPVIQDKLMHTLAEFRQTLSEAFGLSMTDQQSMFSNLTEQSGSMVMNVVRSTLSASAFSLLLLILIPIYTVLILFYRHTWMKVLGRLFPSERTESLHRMISLTIQSYYNFIKGMAIVYLVVGVLNSVGLLLLGVPHAILFGFIVAILTFIPYVGIIIGSLLPIAMAWITYDSIWYPAGVVAIFMFVQYLEANVIFPLAVSNKLNVNTLMMLLAIFAGGVLWGMAGMILFVPFAGIAKLIADHNPKWKTLSMMLGSDKAA
jgi:predicted PurR-regulated permease PerM